MLIPRPRVLSEFSKHLLRTTAQTVPINDMNKFHILPCEASEMWIFAD